MIKASGQTKKSKRYERLYDQIKNLLTAETGIISKMATISAVLHHKIDYFFWTGFYLLENENLTVGPYQGPLACQILPKNKGVCWKAINTASTIIVRDVNTFPDHIACDSRSKSEIALPVFDNNNIIIGVFDVDSKEIKSFDETDKIMLEKILGLIYSGSANYQLHH